MTVQTAEEKDELWKQFRLWNHVNDEMIAAAFTVRRHIHENEYLYGAPIDVNDIYGRSRQPKLNDEIDEVKSAFTTQVQKLRHFYEMIDLQHVAPGVIPQPPKNEDEDLDKLLNLLNRRVTSASRNRKTLMRGELKNLKYLRTTSNPFKNNFRPRKVN